jgi:hypothetical protein
MYLLVWPWLFHLRLWQTHSLTAGFLKATHRAGGWPNALYLYSGDARFESWPGDQLSWLRIFIVFLSLSGKIPA